MLVSPQLHNYLHLHPEVDKVSSYQGDLHTLELYLPEVDKVDHHTSEVPYLFPY
jgi:hypothetical protein